MGNSVRLTLASPTENFTHMSPSSAIRIGRSNKCEFTIPREDLSREHCLFEVVGDEYYVTDLGSKNGISVDRIQITPNVRTKVKDDSLIMFSNIYTLKINALEIYSKKDMISKLSPASSEKETVSFSLDLDRTTEKRMPVLSKRRKKPQSTEAAETPNYEIFKMAAGFLLIVGFVVYHALGR
jgi:pSer/pThr/pTyr-binding forkhead associated (FHA) protein